MIILKEDIFKISKRKKVIAACGCFDIFHIGHLEYLQGARQLGDILIVGINSDQSVQRIKGKYPMFSASERMKVINALKCVDYVFEFNELTFDDSLTKIRPHIFAKGIDRKMSELKEMETVLKFGIELFFIGDSKKSSSSILRKILQ